MADMYFEDDEPCYVISVVAKLVDLHPQTLRYYERVGLIKPSRTSGRIRLYSQNDIENLRRIARITDELGVKNLAGVEVIMNMNKRIEELQQQIIKLKQQHQEELQAYRDQIQGYEEKMRQQGQAARSASRGIHLVPVKPADEEG